MVIQEQVEKILATGKRSRGPLIDAAVEALLQRGRTKKDAFAELADALEMSPATLGQGYFRRTAQRNGPARAVRVTSDTGARTVVSTSRVSPAVAHARGELERAITAYAEAVAQERLAEIRRVLG